MHAPNIPSGATAQLIITAIPAFDRDGNRITAHFDALLDDRVLAAATRQPLLDGCRVLLAEGCDPGCTALLIHVTDPGRICLRARLGTAASLTTKERGRGIIGFEPWKAYSSPVEPPIEFKRAPVPNCRSAAAIPGAPANSLKMLDFLKRETPPASTGGRAAS
jgi:hypothetical protein